MNKRCSPAFDSPFSDVDKALEKCDSDNRCKVVMDSGCNHDIYYTCSGEEGDSDMGDCIYSKGRYFYQACFILAQL